MRTIATLAALAGLLLPSLAVAEGCPRTAEGARALVAGRTVIASRAEGGFAQDGFTSFAGSGLMFGIQPVEYELQTKRGQVRELRIYLPGTNVAPYSYAFRNAHGGATCTASECKWEKPGSPLGALNRATLMETIYKRGAVTLWCFYTNQSGW
ncbi:hypothetical protein FHS95_001337 [Sphingomonas naasensis]|uniref:Uncharacterized protein n=1 Tax=Sphingomonas naasensis TaxID=1344951 RepID=A0A4S1W383_9SPHN|nr:hypothetical protein [Sphingomonas naasensis]NIJ19668.1 hypothetical protein [Sphingomonas naasensis]TGX37261.1 hypothetical protein E5A74_20150 [Sphingomonas naasensis]